jgi:hypothetical protein
MDKNGQKYNLHLCQNFNFHPPNQIISLPLLVGNNIYAIALGIFVNFTFFAF